MANHHEPCECEELKKQQQNECKEKTQQQALKIQQLEKKLMTLTIVGAVAVTVIGKEMVDKIINAFSNVQEVQQKITGEATPHAKVSDSSTNNNNPFRTI